MRKSLWLILVVFTVNAGGALMGCAEDSTVEYQTVHDPQYEITYLLTEFESETHRNAETVYVEYGMRGYNYIFDDPSTREDYVEPHAKQSEHCRTTEGLDSDEYMKGDTDKVISPPPPKCSIRSGYQINQDNPFQLFGSDFSFHMKGAVAGDGVGFGTYFANYHLLPLRDPEDDDRILKDINGNIPPTFTSGRYNALGEAVCKDDAEFAGVISPNFYSDKRVPFHDRFLTDKLGKYPVTGSIYTAGYIFEDTDGKEQAEISHKYAANVKEPRCLADMGQTGFVMWATGNIDVEVALSIPETTPISDGGTCDDEAGEKCYDFHKFRFSLDGAWREYHAEFNDFLQEGWGELYLLNPNRIINIQIKVVPPTSGERKPFDLWLDHVGFYGGTKWAFVEQLADTDQRVIDTESDFQ